MRGLLGLVSLAATALLLGCGSSGGLSACSNANISWDQAAGRIGEKLSVSGPVEGAAFEPYVSGAPTFLDIGHDYPNPNRVTVVIWSENRSRFAVPPDKADKGHNIVVTGKVSEYRGRPQIVVSDPGQIRTC
jgi:hypothetical protein